MTKFIPRITGCVIEGEACEISGTRYSVWSRTGKELILRHSQNRVGLRVISAPPPGLLLKAVDACHVTADTIIGGEEPSGQVLADLPQGADISHTLSTPNPFVLTMAGGLGSSPFDAESDQFTTRELAFRVTFVKGDRPYIRTTRGLVDHSTGIQALIVDTEQQNPSWDANEYDGSEFPFHSSAPEDGVVVSVPSGANYDNLDVSLGFTIPYSIAPYVYDGKSYYQPLSCLVQLDRVRVLAGPAMTWPSATLSDISFESSAQRLMMTNPVEGTKVRQRVASLFNLCSIVQESDYSYGLMIAVRIKTSGVVLPENARYSFLMMQPYLSVTNKFE